MNSLSSLSANVVLSWHCAWCVLFGRNVKKCFCCLRLWNSFAVNTFASGDQSFTAFDRRSRPEINFLPHLGELRNFSWHSLQFKSVQFTFIWGGLFTGHEKCIWTILLQYIYIYILYIQSCEKVRTPYWIPWFSVSLAGLKIAPCHYIYIYIFVTVTVLFVCVCMCVCVCVCVCVLVSLTAYTRWVTRCLTVKLNLAQKCCFSFIILSFFFKCIVDKLPIVNLLLW